MAREPIEKRGIQSIGIGISILQALADADAAMPLASIAKATGVPPSSCHRYLASFIKAGFVGQDGVSGRYDLGPGIIQAGLAALRRADPIVCGLKVCEELAEVTGCTAQLSIWSEAGPIIVSWRMGSVPVPTNLAVGSRLPLLNSATGRVFLAFLPPVYWEALARRENGADVHWLAAEVRTAGFATVAGDLIPGLSAAAAPLIDARGQPAAVVTLLALDGELRSTDTERLVASVATASAALGAAPAFKI